LVSITARWRVWHSSICAIASFAIMASAGCRLAPATLGRSPNQEILRVRTERARALLLETDLTLSAVARQCGFGSAKYFGDAFQRQTGTTPGAFRRRAREPGHINC
jgi:transcriptional regulator GlxA family with amidase domain